MYTYIAGATGLDASMPLWVQAGGREAWIARLRDPAIRARVAEEMRRPGQGWENLYHGAGADGHDVHRLPQSGAAPLRRARRSPTSRGERGTSPEETMMDLVVEDGSRVGTIYFLMSEDNVRREVALALDELRLGRGQRRQRRRLPERPSASAHLRQFRPAARPLRPRRAADHAAGGGAAADLDAGGQSRHPGARRRCGPASMPISPSSIRRRSPTAPPSRSRIAMRSACATSSSTAARCWPTASRPAPRRAGSCAARAGTAARRDTARDKSLIATEPKARVAVECDGGVGSERTHA